MGTKVLARSAGVLDEADRQQRIIDWVLFTHEQADQLRYIEGEWNVGDPIYNRPSPNMGEQCVRYMIEEFEDGDFHMSSRCEDCNVSWRGEEPCFVCGKERLRRSYDDGLWLAGYELQEYSASDVQITVDMVNRLSAAAMRISEALTPMAEAMGRMRHQLTELMEAKLRELNVEMDRHVLHVSGLGVPTGIQRFQRFMLNEWVQDRPEAEPETVEVNGIRMPRDIPTTPEIPLPDMERVSIRRLDEPRYVNSEPIWSRRGRA